jgi:hypothetical protein
MSLIACGLVFADWAGLFSTQVFLDFDLAVL